MEVALPFARWESTPSRAHPALYCPQAGVLGRPAAHRGVGSFEFVVDHLVRDLCELLLVVSRHSTLGDRRQPLVAQTSMQHGEGSSLQGIRKGRVGEIGEIDLHCAAVGRSRGAASGFLSEAYLPSGSAPATRSISAPQPVEGRSFGPRACGRTHRGERYSQAVS